MPQHKDNEPVQKPCIVFLPGLLCDDAVWTAQKQALDFAEVFVPSYGELSSISRMAQSVLDSVPAPRFSLAGHSMGGRVALEMVRIAPQRVARLALLDTGSHPLAAGDAGERERQGRMALLETARRQGMREMGREWARGMVHPSRVNSALFEQILDMIERQTPAKFEAQINALLSRPDARGVLEQLRVPTLFVCGRQDAWSPLSQHEAMRALVAGSRLVVIEDSGHMTTMEQCDAVSAALLAWMQE
jgi:pimeloyl-ACP methyl ester carboxylesterase